MPSLVEHAPKRAILRGRNSLFYKSFQDPERSADGGLFLSLIHNCELNGANSFDSLIELQRHAAELKQNPSE